MSQAKQKIPGTNRLALAGVALALAALGIAFGVFLYNGEDAQAGTCPARPEVAKAIDKVAVGQLAALQVTARGRGYADLNFFDDQGNPLTLADFSGKPLLVNFWATWCIPCREEMPELDTLAASYSTDQFAVVPINLDLGADGVDKAHAFLKEVGLTNLPVFADPTFNAFERLKKNGIALGLPATLLLDENGCEMAVLQGPAAWAAKSGRAVIDTLIKATKRPAGE